MEVNEDKPLMMSEAEEKEKENEVELKIDSKVSDINLDDYKFDVPIVVRCQDVCPCCLRQFIQTIVSCLGGCLFIWLIIPMMCCQGCIAFLWYYVFCQCCCKPAPKDDVIGTLDDHLIARPKLCCKCCVDCIDELRLKLLTTPFDKRGICWNIMEWSTTWIIGFEYLLSAAGGPLQ